MKYMTIEHMKKLDNIKLNKYLLDCVYKLEQIDYEDEFEENKENYFRFVKHVHKVANDHYIHSKKDIFALMLLWHVEGNELIRDEAFLEVFLSKKLSNHEKGQYFLNRAIKSMKGED